MRKIYFTLHCLLALCLIGCGSDPDLRPDSSPDVVAPTPGEAGALSKNLATDAVKISWSAASDAGTPPSSLQYLVYRSTTNNVGNVVDIKANGLAVGSFAANIADLTEKGLTPNSTYFYNVIVKDAAGNESAYEATSATTTSVIYLFEEGTNRNGDLKTAGSFSTARVSGDALCEAKRAASHSNLNCLTTKVFLSIGSDDEIRDMPSNYLVPTNLQLQGPTGLKIADDWANILDNSIDANFNAASIVTGSNFWGGSDSPNDGSVSGAACNAFTSSNDGVSGGVGQANITSFWLAVGALGCDFALHQYVCMCW